MDLATKVALASAIATTLSALFVAWQALETRRSAKSARQAAEASEAALEVANESLELNRRQAEQSAFMVAEATRARLETNAPVVSMQFVEGDNPHPNGYIVGIPSDPESYERRNIGDVFQLPQDSELWLYALFNVKFHNDGALPVTIWSGSTFVPVYEGLPLSPTFRLGKGESVTWYLAVGTSLAGWTESRDDKTKPRGQAGWATELSGDSGVRLTQTVHIDGTILGSGQREGDFILRGLGDDPNWPSFLVKDQAKRTYWLGGTEIPALAPGGVFGGDGQGFAISNL